MFYMFSVMQGHRYLKMSVQIACDVILDQHEQKKKLVDAKRKIEDFELNHNLK